MKKILGIGIVALLAAGLGGTWPAAAQTESNRGPLDRLESGIRTANGPPVTAAAAAPRVYLGAFADNDTGRGIRVLSVRPGGPADRAGLQPRDLVVAAAGHKIVLLSELTAILNGLNPGDHLSLDVVRGIRRLRLDVVLGAPPSTAQLGQPVAPPPTGPGHTESIPPPPSDLAPPGLSPPAPAPEGPALNVPNLPKVPIDPSQTQIQELQRRVEQLERRVQELERALAESKRK